MQSEVEGNDAAKYLVIHIRNEDVEHKPLP